MTTLSQPLIAAAPKPEPNFHDLLWNASLTTITLLSAQYAHNTNQADRRDETMAEAAKHLGSVAKALGYTLVPVDAAHHLYGEAETCRALRTIARHLPKSSPLARFLTRIADASLTGLNLRDMDVDAAEMALEELPDLFQEVWDELRDEIERMRT